MATLLARSVSVVINSPASRRDLLSAIHWSRCQRFDKYAPVHTPMSGPSAIQTALAIDLKFVPAH